MKYFNGFLLKGEDKFFEEYTDRSDFTVAGFSYGAQLAFEAALQSSERVEKLTLLSPAFFQCEKSRFVRMQLRYFAKDRASYIEHFLENAAYPETIDLSRYLGDGTPEQLEALLSYRWESEKVRELLSRGTTIEVYLGGRDRIINSAEAFDFFSSLTTSYFIKRAGHLLQLGESSKSHS